MVFKSTHAGNEKEKQEKGMEQRIKEEQLYYIPATPIEVTMNAINAYPTKKGFV